MELLNKVRASEINDGDSEDLEADFIMADDESDAQDDLFQEAIEKFRSQLIEQDLEDEEDSIIMQNFLKPQSKNPLQRSQ